MNNNNLQDLARLRLERATELISETKMMLENRMYKSANNRAYYAAEKALKAILALKGKDSETHSGTLKLFNMLYINVADPFFNHEDYSSFQRMERIRSLSDYDDFYITSKAECENQVSEAVKLIQKVTEYLKREGMIE